MSEDRISPPAHRARPVADAPVEALVARAEELARRWALVLLGARPLVEMPGVPLEDIARYAPALCVSIARSLSSEEELASFDAARDAADRGGSAAGLGVLAGGWDAASAVEHVEALRGIIWRAALEELHDPTARQVADLSDRLASVSAAVLACAIAERPGAVSASAPRRVYSAPRERVREQILFSAPGPAPGTPGAVLIDERDEAQRPVPPRAARRREDRSSAAPAPARADRPPQREDPASPGRTSPARPRPLPWDTPLQPSAERPDAALEREREQRSVERAEDPVMRLRRGPGAPADRRS